MTVFYVINDRHNGAKGSPILLYTNVCVLALDSTTMTPSNQRDSHGLHHY